VCIGRPVLFLDERAGCGAKPFKMIKFRTMLQGSGPDSERLTSFGRFLRASSLDELPELINVVRGDMSLVGPRPLPTRYLARYDAEQARRHEVLPGITGWAQVNGRNSVEWEEKFKLDLYYVENHSFRLDLKILFMTFWQVIFARNVSHKGCETMPEFTPLRDNRKI